MCLVDEDAAADAPLTTRDAMPSSDGTAGETQATPDGTPVVTADGAPEVTVDVSSGSDTPGVDDTRADARADVVDDARADAQTDSAGLTDAADASDTHDSMVVDTGSCAPLEPSTCTSTGSSGNIAGDNGGLFATQGWDNARFRVEIVETNQGPGQQMKLKFVLKSSHPNDYDLFIYFGPQKFEGGGVQCTIPTYSSTNTDPDVIHATWGDTVNPPDADNGRSIIVEVRSSTGVCGSGISGWSLEMWGNQ